MLRERETLLWLFAMPVLFFWFLGTMMGGRGGGGAAPRRDHVAALVPADAGFLAERVLARLEASGFDVVRAKDAAEAEPYVRRLEFPAGFTAMVQRGERAQVVWRRLPGDDLAPEGDKIRAVLAVYGVLADVVLAAVRSGGGAGEPGEASLRALDA